MNQSRQLTVLGGLVSVVIAIAVGVFTLYRLCSWRPSLPPSAEASHVDAMRYLFTGEVTCSFAVAASLLLVGILLMVRFGAQDET